MNSLIGLVVGLLFVMPLATFVHELGHAAPQLFAGHKVEVSLGNKEKAKVVVVGNLKLSISAFPMNVGFSSIAQDSSNNLKVLALLMGPITSLVLCVSLFLLSRYESPYLVLYLLNFGFYYSFAQFLMTALPIYYPSFFGAYDGMPSDGRQIMELFELMKGQEA